MNITTCLEAVVKSRVDILVRTPNCVIIRVIRLRVSLAWVARVKVFDARDTHLNERNTARSKRVKNTKIPQKDTKGKDKKLKVLQSHCASSPVQRSVQSFAFVQAPPPWIHFGKIRWDRKRTDYS